MTESKRHSERERERESEGFAFALFGDSLLRTVIWLRSVCFLELPGSRVRWQSRTGEQVRLTRRHEEDGRSEKEQRKRTASVVAESD